MKKILFTIAAHIRCVYTYSLFSRLTWLEERCGLIILTTFQETFQMDQHWITFELPTFNQGWQVNIDKEFILVDVKLINLSTHIQRWSNVESLLCACWVGIGMLFLWDNSTALQNVLSEQKSSNMMVLSVCFLC